MKVEFVQVSPRTGLLIGAGVIVGGLLISGWKSGRVLEAIDSYGWPQVVAELDAAEFHSERKRSGTGNSTTITHYGEFAYRYVVGGQEYAGTRHDASGRMGQDARD